MNKEYKLTSLSKKKYFYKILINTLSIYIIVLLSYIFYKKVEDVFLILQLFFGMLIFGWFLIFGLPLFILFLNHKKHSKSVSLKQINNEFIYKNSSKQFKFNISEITKIELWLTPTSYDKRTDWQYFGKYHFTSIHLKSGQVINISCLVFDETTEVFPKELIERRKKFLPLMKKNNLSVD